MAFKLKRLGSFSALIGREAAPLCNPKSLPMTIHIFWDQGFEKAPPLVQRCIESWRLMNPEWKLNLLGSAEAEKVLPRTALPREASIAAYSDALRMRLLRTKGGVWVDATCLCTKPLANWLPWMMSQSDFFAFSRPAYDRPLASWFLASQPEGEIVSRLDDDIAAYLTVLRVPPRAYLWLHYLFEAKLLKSRSFRKTWRHVPSLSATPIHLAQTILVERRSPTSEELQVLSLLPMHKLTYKKGVTDVGVAELFKEINHHVEWQLS